MPSETWPHRWMLVCRVVDMRGNVLAQNLDSYGLDPVVAWQAKSDAEVIVRVYGYPAAPDSTISYASGDDYTYRLTVTTGPLRQCNPSQWH
jgi:hypothetical protein